MSDNNNPHDEIQNFMGLVAKAANRVVENYGVSDNMESKRNYRTSLGKYVCGYCAASVCEHQLSFNRYMHQTSRTAVYPGSGNGTFESLSYVALGLNGEAGEIAEKVKKLLRGDITGENMDEWSTAIRKEIGDVTWYLARLCIELGFGWSEIAQENLNKLDDRKARGVIKGSGDSR